MAIRRGNKIIDELLKGARLVSVSDDGIKTYEKSGGSKQMLKDFFAMKPTDIKPNLVSSLYHAGGSRVMNDRIHGMSCRSSIITSKL